MQDTFKHKGLRKILVNELRDKGISNEEVLSALNAVPRHLFLDNAFLAFAYQDKAFPIGAGQTISQPYTVAFQSALLEVQKGDKILEIGTGSGYQTSVLCELGAKVFSIERQRSLHIKTKALLQRMNYRARLFYGDGFKGLPTFAPFDKCIVTCGAPYIPQDIVDQVKVGGKIVIPVGEGDEQTMILLVKEADGSTTKKELGIFRFVPMLEDKANNLH